MLSTVAAWVVCVTLMKGWEAAQWIDTWPSLWKTSKNNLMSFLTLNIYTSGPELCRIIQSHRLATLLHTLSVSVTKETVKWSLGSGAMVWHECCCCFKYAILFIIYFQFIFILHPRNPILPARDYDCGGNAKLLTWCTCKMAIMPFSISVMILYRSKCVCQ